MIDYANVKSLTDYIIQNNGVGDKSILANMVKAKFQLTLDRKLYYCDDFAIRFSQANSTSFSNTVLSLSALQKFDDRPVIVCVVLPKTNYMLLCNTTCLKKISHSSQQLRTDNIKGSFNGSDILKTIADTDNVPSNFEKLFTMHQEYTFEENLERLVESTNNIAAHGHKFVPSIEQKACIRQSPQRTKTFIKSEYYQALNLDLQQRVNRVKNEIAIAAFIDNVNIKGNIIEYLITSDEDITRYFLTDALINGKPLPYIKNANDLGDYNFNFKDFNTKTDIKTKILFLGSNPKAYNIDKLLKFLATDKSVYMLYFVGIDDKKNITTYLCPVFDKTLIGGTVIIKHWAGRNSKGVAQFFGEHIHRILLSKSCDIDERLSSKFIEDLLEL